VFLDDLGDAVGANFEAALAILSAAGARIERRSLPLVAEMAAVTREHGSLITAEAYDFHHERVDGPDAARIDRRVVARMLLGKAMSAHDLLTVQRTRRELAARLKDELGGALLAIPTVAHVAPEIAPLEADDELFHQTNLKTLRNTSLGNFLGLCGLALPSGKDASGLPTGILFSAPGGEDERLLSFGLSIERALIG
jgi:aspartyl-tRNA(Asn)/glutamyl-tRNA(Gln) amidotransferase subunit A